MKKRLVQLRLRVLPEHADVDPVTPLQNVALVVIGRISRRNPEVDRWSRTRSCGGRIEAIDLGRGRPRIKNKQLRLLRQPCRRATGEMGWIRVLGAELNEWRRAHLRCCSTRDHGCDVDAPHTHFAGEAVFPGTSRKPDLRAHDRGIGGVLGPTSVIERKAGARCPRSNHMAVEVRPDTLMVVHVENPGSTWIEERLETVTGSRRRNGCRSRVHCSTTDLGDSHLATTF